jgi:hypothetical protein
MCLRLTDRGTCFASVLQMILYIKNMICARCITVVRYEIEKIGLNCKSVELGFAELADTPSADQIIKIKNVLLSSGLQLIDNKRAILVEKIKNVIVEMVYFSNFRLRVNFSAYLSEKLDHDYTYLANIFSVETGMTIEHFIIKHKIQRIKDLMEDDELNLTEISWKLHYSSVAHLSTQFKKVTGLTPSHFKQLERENQMSPANV